jgi:hypothetical protein
MKMTDFDYKKYSLKKLETWVEDALSAADASPQEIYDTIRKVVEDNYYCYKYHTGRCYELLALLNGNGKGHLSCDKDDQSPECKKSWTSFWEETDDGMRPWGHSDLEYKGSTVSSVDEKYKNQLEKELLQAKINASSSFNDGWTRKYYEDRVKKLEEKLGIKKDKVVKWILPVEETKVAETDETEYFITFPDDLLEAADLKEGDKVEWVDQGDGSYLLKKVENPMTHDKMLDAGYWMTDDGFWIPPQNC